ncbi:MAG: signal transduction protein [Nitrosarchaeum sp.]|nr:signal transduction protein [Nitrosarchaeum sp.]
MKSKIRVSNFMRTNVLATNSNTTVQEAAKTMDENNVSSLLIEDEGKITGIVTERDISMARYVFDTASRSTVKEIMTSPVVSIDPDSSILDAAELMDRKQIHKIPVIKDGKLAGIISATDLVMLFSTFEKEELEKKFGYLIDKNTD